MSEQQKEAHGSVKWGTTYRSLHHELKRPCKRLRIHVRKEKVNKQKLAYIRKNKLIDVLDLGYLV